MEKLIKKNAALLTGLMLVKKILSIIYKIPYQNQLGDAGFYVFQQVYPFVGLLMVLTGFVLPTVIGSLLNENHYHSALKDKLKRSMWIFSLLVFAIMFLGNLQIALLMGDIMLAPVIRAAGIHFLFLPIISYLRGVLQSRPETMGKIGYSIVIEQVVRVVAVLAVVFFVNLETHNYYRVAELAFMMSLISPIVTLFYLYWLQPVDDAQTFRPLITKVTFLQQVIFLALSSGILIIFNMVDSFLVFNTLITNQSQAESMLLTGVLERGLPLVQAGTFFVGTLVALSMTQLEKSNSMKDKKLAFSTGMFFLMGLAIPGTIGLITVMPEFNNLLFGNQLGTSTLQIFVLQVILYSALVMLTATLTKEGKQAYIQAAFLVGVVIKLLITVPLVNNFNITGAAISSVFSLGVMLLIMIHGGRYLITTRLLITLAGISTATFGMWLGINYTQSFLSQSSDLLTVVIMIVVGIIIYGLIMAIFIGLFRAMMLMFKTEQDKRQQEIEKREKQQQKKADQERLERQRVQQLEAERLRRIESLMQNSNQQRPVNQDNVNEYNIGRGHWQLQEAEMEQEEIQEEVETKIFYKYERNEKRMRLDKFLKVSRIIKRRQTAKEVSDAGKIEVNGRVAKSSTSLSVGDEIALHYATRTLVIRVLALLDSTKKEDAERMFEIVSETPH